MGLAGDPELLFLDEPTTGFDPSARRDAWEMIRGLRSLGKTVVLTTHYMEEAEYLADRVAILVSGRIVAEGSVEELVRREGRTTIRFRVAGAAPPGHLSAEPAGEDGAYMITTLQATSSLNRLTGWALDAGVDLRGLTVAAPSLEDLFLALAGSPERDAGP